MKEFLLKPKIAIYDSLKSLLEEKKIGKEDLIITNEFVLMPQLGNEEPPCDVLYQEKFGQGEPSDEMINGMFKEMKGKTYKRIVAIGGGTIIDISKLFVFGADCEVEELYEKGAALEKKSELIILPTTCGTGSEVTNISIVEFKKKHTKLGLAIPQLFADEAALVPGMLKTLPYGVFATSSIDALVHAMESYISPEASPFSRMFGKEAIGKILNGYLEMREKGEAKLPADMEDFLIASTMAGIAFGNAGCAAVHALSYPIGGNYHVPHGKANYMVFESVFNMYKELGADLSPLEVILEGIFKCDASEVWEKMFDLLSFVLENQKLGELGVDAAKAEEMAVSVLENQQRLLGNNPIELSKEQIVEIYVRCI
ncbi:4-hydroxybutyrate dehydrogenase [Aequitasia blattaphilus]|uniref:Iron-containing alcohol dehydrogenase n=1 Tax=Aequitasia blattaphilus TaxID=2949332 RepID=A0ABT1ECW4_9FIRM|nr:iron-containing alcohol dehydrogenase [Aequitasia blattaphilus]MCP1103681.1 iron-containing alcohol dehydrogenase [Aequitasia blattaphilus]MCR8616321.1 iron-containing alcohol dehydrogenase [Aequitasia blattaphilus]